MFHEYLARTFHRIEKKNTFYRKALPVGLKLAITLHCLASGDSYHLASECHTDPSAYSSPEYVRRLSQAMQMKYSRLLQPLKNGRGYQTSSPRTGCSIIPLEQFMESTSTPKAPKRWLHLLQLQRVSLNHLTCSSWCQL